MEPKNQKSMKSIIIITLLTTCGMATTMFGQLSLNFSAGMNNSNCRFEEFKGLSESPEARLGYCFGVGPEYEISKKIHVQVDFQYSIKGFDTGTGSNLVPSGFRYQYVDIIPEVEFHFLQYLALGLGVNYGVKVDEQIKISDGDWSEPFVKTINSTDFGLVFKVEANFKNIFGFVRYNTGLNNIAEGLLTDDNGLLIEDAKQLNRNLQIGLGYKLRFKL